MEDWLLQSTCRGREAAPIVVLVHSLGSSHVMWDECVKMLEKDFRLVLMDLPGHGGSQPAPLGEKMTMGRLLDAIERTLDSLGVEQFHFAGLSIGGMIACGVAQRWGVESSGRLLSATAMASGAQNGTPQTWIERADLIRAEGTVAVVEPTMERWFSPSFRLESPAAVERIRSAFIDCDAQGYAQCCEVLETTDLRLGMADIRVPFAVVNGSEDAGFGDQAASALVATLVNAPWTDVVHISDARHMCAMESPERAVAAIRAAVSASER